LTAPDVDFGRAQRPKYRAGDERDARRRAGRANLRQVGERAFPDVPPERSIRALTLSLSVVGSSVARCPSARQRLQPPSSFLTA
jgi:hypothetical protein